MAKVWMKGPDGDVREVEDSVEALSPLMKEGWKQAAPPAPDKRKNRGKERDGEE